MVLREPANPRIDIIDAAVDLLKHCLQPGVAGDFRKTCIPCQTEGLAAGIVVSEPVIAAALNIQGRQVEQMALLLFELAEQQRPKALHDVGVNLLHRAKRQARQEGFDAAFIDQGRLEVAIPQRHRVLARIKRNAVGDHGVAHPIAGRREDIADIGPRRRVISGIRRDRARPQQRGQELVVSDCLHQRPDNFARALINGVVFTLPLGVLLNDLAA